MGLDSNEPWVSGRRYLPHDHNDQYPHPRPYLRNRLRPCAAALEGHEHPFVAAKELITRLGFHWRDGHASSASGRPNCSRTTFRPTTFSSSYWRPPNRLTSLPRRPRSGVNDSPLVGKVPTHGRPFQVSNRAHGSNSARCTI